MPKLRIDHRLRRFIVDQRMSERVLRESPQIPGKKEAEPLSCPDSKLPRDDALGSSVQPWKAGVKRGRQFAQLNSVQLDCNPAPSSTHITACSHLFPTRAPATFSLQYLSSHIDPKLFASTTEGPMRGKGE